MDVTPTLRLRKEDAKFKANIGQTGSLHLKQERLKQNEARHSSEYLPN